MNFVSLIEFVRSDTVQRSLPAFRPELALCITIVLMLLARLPRWGRLVPATWIALPGVLVALYLAEPWRNLGLAENRDVLLGTEIFTGLVVYDEWTVFFRAILLVFAALFIVMTMVTGIPDREDGPDFYTLTLGGILGMSLMASSNHLLMLFLAVEMASLPSYAMAGIMKGRKQGSEAALKYAVYGAGAAGVMLYGISLLAGATGSMHLPTMAERLAELSAAGWGDKQAVLVLGALLVMSGLAFKLSAVPFHFWAPDVFEGACAEVGAYLSVASKAAALAMLVRVAIGLGSAPEPEIAAMADDPPAAVAPVDVAAAPEDGAAGAAAVTEAGPVVAIASPHERLQPVRDLIVGMVTLLAAVTCTFGNLAAYSQTNIKRLLAYSTIAHAGYMMMPVAAAIGLAGSNRAMASEALASLGFYVATYLFMNLAAFAIVAVLRNTLRSEEIADYAGLIRQSPGVVVLFSIVLVSLIGLPPMAGFAAKYTVFLSLVTAQQWALLAIGGLNTVISLFYYLRVMKVMAIDPEPAERTPLRWSLLSPSGLYLVLVTAPVVVLGIAFDPLVRLARAAAEHLL